MGVWSKSCTSRSALLNKFTSQDILKFVQQELHLPQLCYKISQLSNL